ncbi:MAG: GTPase [Pirellulaceae bacterium]
MVPSLPSSDCHVRNAHTCRAAVLTPRARGAVATVIAEGSGVTALVQQLFQPASGKPLAQYPCDRIVFGHWQAPQASGARIGRGEELVVCRRTPTLIEIHCHGGSATVDQVLNSLVAAGCRTLSAAQWTLSRAEDRLIGEARLALAHARTLRVAGVLMDQYRGALSHALRGAIDLTRAGDVPAARRALVDLLAWSSCGLRLIHPWRIALVGKTNVGKSSLLNALLGYQRSLVDPAAGTTRDILTALTTVDGWPVELIDTAGSRVAASDVEREGIARAERQGAIADLVLVVSDVSTAWTRDDEAWVSISPIEPIILHNKVDLCTSIPLDRPAGLATSARTGAGLPELVEVVARRLVPRPPPPGTAVPFLKHHCEEVQLALQALSESAGEQACGLLQKLLTVPQGEADTMTDYILPGNSR